MSERILDIQNRINNALENGRPQDFFNNFILKFPYPPRWQNFRYMIEIAGNMQRSFREAYPGIAEYGSETLLNQTPAEFFELVDELTSEIGFKKEEVMRIVTSRTESDRFYTEIAPQVFVRLIQLGYNEQELTI